MSSLLQSERGCRHGFAANRMRAGSIEGEKAQCQVQLHALLCLLPSSSLHRRFHDAFDTPQPHGCDVAAYLQPKELQVHHAFRHIMKSEQNPLIGNAPS
jgi:hypothetical protein